MSHWLDDAARGLSEGRFSRRQVLRRGGAVAAGTLAASITGPLGTVTAASAAPRSRRTTFPCPGLEHVCYSPEVCCAGKDCCKEDDCCGGTVCCTKDEMCCGGVCRPQHSDDECCGTRAIDPTLEQCCDEGETHVCPEHGYDCCGKDDCCTKDEMCCDGRCHYHPRNSDDECCGARTYDASYEQCCDEGHGHICLKDSHDCCGASACCKKDEECCHSGKLDYCAPKGHCCPKGQHSVTCGSGSFSGRICCDEDEECCGGHCCKREDCEDGVCKKPKVKHKKCDPPCPSGLVCCPSGTCCAAGECCGGGCCGKEFFCCESGDCTAPAGLGVCCGPPSNPEENNLYAGASGHLCCTGGVAGNVCPNKECCPASGRICCDVCCPAGTLGCEADGTCAPYAPA